MDREILLRGFGLSGCGLIQESRRIISSIIWAFLLVTMFVFCASVGFAGKDDFGRGENEDRGGDPIIEEEPTVSPKVPPDSGGTIGFQDEGGGGPVSAKESTISGTAGVPNPALETELNNMHQKGEKL